MSIECYVTSKRFSSSQLKPLETLRKRDKLKSTFKNDAGEITFDGTIAPNSTYDFENNAGAIKLTLPSNTSFVLNASAGLGKVSNDFGSNTVGSHPSSQIHVHTNAGSVNIHEK